MRVAPPGVFAPPAQRSLGCEDIGRAELVFEETFHEANPVVDVFLTAPVLVEADCQNPGGNVAPGQAFETTVTGSQLQLRPENGQITNTISIDASGAQDPVASQVCPHPQWTVVNVRRTFTGEFDLFAVVHHQDGSTTRLESGF